jgi:hypothetical protein
MGFMVLDSPFLTVREIEATSSQITPNTKETKNGRISKMNDIGDLFFGTSATPHALQA